MFWQWLIVGLVVGAVFYHFIAGAISGKYHVHWYQWLLGVAAVALYVLTIQNYLGFQDEYEPVLANLMLLVMGVPAVVLTALIWILPLVFRGKKAQPTARTT